MGQGAGHGQRLAFELVNQGIEFLAFLSGERAIIWCLGTDWQQTALLLHFLASPVSIGAYVLPDEPHHSSYPELPANLAWGEDGSVLFLTARTSVYRLQTRTRGTLLG